MSEDSETDSDFRGAQNNDSTIVNARVPAIADPQKTRRVRDKGGSKDAGKFSTSTPNETKNDSKSSKNKSTKKGFSLNCFSRDPSESPDDVSEIMINSSTISGGGKSKHRAHSRGHTSESDGYELSKEYKTAKSFRPISLSSYLLKGMERTILWHLKETTLKTEPINEEVYSYKEGVSTENALHKVTYKIEKALSKNNYALAVFLDISGAFSNAKISEMIKDLEDRGVEKQVVKWIGSILSERNITTTLAGAAISKKATRGTPEGAKLSPPIWNMKGSKPVDKFPKEEKVDCTGFADDFNLLTIGSNPRILRIDMQWGLIKLEQWAKKN